MEAPADRRELDLPEPAVRRNRDGRETAHLTLSDMAATPTVNDR